MRLHAWALAAALLSAGPVPAASIIDQLRDRDVPQTSRFTFSGSTDIRYVDGGPDITPFNFNNQFDVGGVSTFTALKVHLFLDALLSKRSSVFVKLSGGSPDAARVNIDALAVTTKLGDDWPNLVAGRFLNNFGRYPQRFLGPDNPLIGDPLLYTYLTALTSTEVPASPADLVSQRGKGLASKFAGYGAAARGQAIVSNNWYLNGLQLTGAYKKLSYNASLTNEAISAANFFDVNDNKTLTMHLGYKPDIAWQIGISVSNGAYLDHAVLTNPAVAAIHLDDFAQTTIGVDIDYAAGPFSFFAEYMHNWWETPFVHERLQVDGFFFEPRYKLMPGLSAVMRLEAMWFGDINVGGALTNWDFDIARVEFGLNYSIERDLIVKMTYQVNDTKVVGGKDPDDNVIQAQLVGVF